MEMKVDILNIQGEKTGRQADLPEALFGVEPNEHVVYLAVKQYLAHQRQGTHKAKERNEIKGSTKKLKRQKGTGTARFGDIKNPLFRGGVRVFGPRPRNYEVRLNKKVKRLARKSALSSLMSQERVVVVESFNFEEPKTKNYAEVLGKLGVENGKSLLLLAEQKKNILLSSRNIPKAKVCVATDLNTYDIMNAGTLIISEDALDAIKAFA
jgi:large subunit ribosomal protein L4